MLEIAHFEAEEYSHSIMRPLVCLTSSGALEDQPAVFTLMQHYRNIQSPHGVVAGPHRGCALSGVQQELTALGVMGV